MEQSHLVCIQEGYKLATQIKIILEVSDEFADEGDDTGLTQLGYDSIFMDLMAYGDIVEITLSEDG